MTKLAIIGGTGLTSIKDLKITKKEVAQSPFGQPSGVLQTGELFGKEVLFLPRHGASHTIPPHKVNYRANLWVLKQAGVDTIIAVNAVGGIDSNLKAGQLVIPDQIIDYTTSRTNTFFEEGLKEVVHVDFTYPYCTELRKKIIAGCAELSIDSVNKSTYAATEGPRLETAQEVIRLERDGCDIVGMTGMPETALARELDICYSCIAVVANLAAGKSDETITMEMINKNLNVGIETVRNVLAKVIPTI